MATDGTFIYKSFSKLNYFTLAKTTKTFRGAIPAYSMSSTGALIFAYDRDIYVLKDRNTGKMQRVKSHVNSFASSDTGLFAFVDDGELYAFNPQLNKIRRLKGGVSSYKISRSGLLAFVDDGELYIYSKNAPGIKRVSKRFSAYDLSPQGGLIFLINQDLFLLSDQKNGRSEKIAQEVKSFSFSPSGKIIFTTPHGKYFFDSKRGIQKFDAHTAPHTHATNTRLFKKQNSLYLQRGDAAAEVISHNCHRLEILKNGNALYEREGQLLLICEEHKFRPHTLAKNVKSWHRKKNDELLFESEGSLWSLNEAGVKRQVSNAISTVHHNEKGMYYLKTNGELFFQGKEATPQCIQRDIQYFSALKDDVFYCRSGKSHFLIKNAQRSSLGKDVSQVLLSKEGHLLFIRAGSLYRQNGMQELLLFHDVSQISYFGEKLLFSQGDHLYFLYDIEKSRQRYIGSLRLR